MKPLAPGAPDQDHELVRHDVDDMSRGAGKGGESSRHPGQHELPYTERPSDARTAKSKSATLSNELMMAAFWYLREEHGSVWR